MLLDRDGFNLPLHTPTLDRHLEYLRSLEDKDSEPGQVIGLSLNSNLYSKSEENLEVESNST